jgi:two-component system sensor histidine kinase CpxA
MKSIFVRILLWISLLFVVSSVAFVATSYYLFRRDSQGNSFMRRVLDSQLDDLRVAWETGGEAALRPQIARMDNRFPGRHSLLDASGTDVLTGEKRDIAGLETSLPPFRWPFGRSPRRAYMLHRSADSRYWMQVVSPEPRIDAPNYLPYYLPIVFVFVLGIYVLAHYIGRPLRQLRETVMRFGSGDLEARTGLRRRDEFGDVARSFDEMAERIQTLLTAERQLLQDISHELRSPLARRSVAVELARTSADRGAALDRIKKEAQRISLLVGELIEMTRAEGDPAERKSAAVDLKELLEELLDDLLIEADEKGIQLERDLQGPIVMQADAELLRRAIENVLRNAIRYSPAEEQVRVRLLREGDEALVIVRDFGPGVPEEMREKIFRPFFRVEDDRARRSGGVGLGLAIAQRAVHLHHGRISARNADMGLEVTIRVPLHG